MHARVLYNAYFYEFFILNCSTALHLHMYVPIESIYMYLRYILSSYILYDLQGTRTQLLVQII